MEAVACLGIIAVKKPTEEAEALATAASLPFDSSIRTSCFVYYYNCCVGNYFIYNFDGTTEGGRLVTVTYFNLAFGVESRLFTQPNT
jgi:hypothetical protein